MPSVADCPECNQQVSIPLGAPPEAQVQCPLCGHSCLLEVVLKHAPPELVILSMPETVGASAASGDSQQGIIDDSPFGEWGPSGELGADEQDTDKDLQLEDPVGSRDLVPVKDDFGFGGGEIDAEGAIEARTQSAEAAAEMPSMAPLVGKKRKNRGGNPLRQMIGVFVGGFMGLAIGYLVLLWIRPEPRVDFLKLGPKLPPFMVPAAFHANPSAASDDDASKPFNSGEATAFDFGDKFGNQDKPNPKTKNPKPADPSPFTPPTPKPEPESTPSKEPPTTEPPKAEPPKIEPPKIEPPTIDPPKVDPPKVNPKPAKPRVRGVVPFTSDQLGVALKDAMKSKDGLIEGTLDNPEFKAAKVNAFKQWCRLAEVYTFSEGTADNAQLKNRQDAVRGITLDLSDALEAQPDLGEMGSGWMRTANRTSDGVVTVGRIIDIQELKDGLQEVEVILLGQTDSTTVVTTNLKDLKSGDLAVIVGAIVSNPKTNLIGYEGEAEQALWSKLLVKIIGE